MGTHKRNRVSGVTSQPTRRDRASAAAMDPSRVRSSSVSWGRLLWRRSTPSWCRRTMISRSLERPERTAKRANDTSNRYRMRHIGPQDASASCLVSAHDRILGTHRSAPTTELWAPTGSTLPDSASHNSSPTGTSSLQPHAELWEPYDGRLSRTVLREREGEVPSRYSPGSASRTIVVRVLGSLSKRCRGGPLRGWLFGRLDHAPARCGCRKLGRGR